MSKTYDDSMQADYMNKEYGCCDCGYRKRAGHHPGIRCPSTGRCGTCGNNWPCKDHANEVPIKLQKQVNRSSYVKK